MVRNNGIHGVGSVGWDIAWVEDCIEMELPGRMGLESKFRVGFLHPLPRFDIRLEKRYQEWIRELRKFPDGALDRNL